MGYTNSEQFTKTLARLRTRAEWLMPDDRVPCDMAKDFVRASAWWLSHPKGPVRAPKHADNLTEHRVYGWQIEFGANAFLVGFAIRLSYGYLTDYLDRAGDGELSSVSDLRLSLLLAPRMAVANYAGERYESAYQLADGYLGKMVFGTQAIDVEDFADRALFWVPIQELQDAIDDW